MRDATYIPHPLAVYAGNPLIETLDIMKYPEDFEKVIAERPSIPDDIMSYDPFLATGLIGELEDTYIPHPNAWHMYKQFTQQIMAGYRKKNPAALSGKRFLNNIVVQCQNGSTVEVEKFFGSMSGTTLCSLATGISGTGKTETIRRVLRCIPQTYRHRVYQGETLNFDQLVWVSFDVTSSNSLKGLAMNFYEAVDAALGTTAYQDEYKLSENVDKHISNIRKICARHYIGLVHIDECQHLLKRIGNPNNATLDHLESLFNRIGVPMLTTSTPEGLRLFFDQDLKNAKLQSTRRLISHNVLDFSPMDRESIFYSSFYETFFPKNVFEGTSILSESFKNDVHYKTFGLQAIAGHLMRLFFTALQANPKYQEGEHCFELLDKIYAQHFGATALAINDLRKHKAQRYEAERALQQQAEAQLIALEKSQSKRGQQSRTNHSSRRGPKMAQAAGLWKLAAMDKRLANIIDHQPLLTGFAEVHK